jgi:phosphatidylserine/phosphatidylglycerophosphate/cardiolipin synthase-like enzyme
MILVDLLYWEANKGRLYTDLLQDPLRARPRLPKQDVAENRKHQARIERALGELREAVAGSKRLQEEAARRGQAWLRKYVSVHLSVMNPADFSYRTGRLIGYLPIAPDTMVRDHRKLAFYDLTERDPGRGAALYGGVGVGEQYATATWEDRAVLLAGPAALTLKDAARRYLKANGVEDSDIPPPLRPLPKPSDYDARVEALARKGWTATANEVHNDRGFARKDASIASAVLYTLMPPGSLIVVPDSIWTHEIWAAHLVGAALRGCHVYVIAPAAENAPSAGFPQMSRTREVWSRFLEVQRILGPEIEARGGRLRAGLYTRKTGVNDLQAQLREMDETFERYPFLKEVFPFPEEFYARVGEAEELLAGAGYKPDERLPADATQRAPKLHRKTQLFVTREALEALVRDRRVQQVIANHVEFNARKGIIVDPDEGRAELGKLFIPYLDAFRELPEDVRKRAVLYMTVGSLNKDSRGMMTDGEVMQVTAGPWAIWAISDMWMLMGSTTWLESQEELDRLLPPYKEWQRRVGRWIRKVL